MHLTLLKFKSTVNTYDLSRGERWRTVFVVGALHACPLARPSVWPADPSPDLCCTPGCLVRGGCGGGVLSRGGSAGGHPAWTPRPSWWWPGGLCGHRDDRGVRGLCHIWLLCGNKLAWVLKFLKCHLTLFNINFIIMSLYIMMKLGTNYYKYLIQNLVYTL